MRLFSLVQCMCVLVSLQVTASRDKMVVCYKPHRHIYKVFPHFLHVPNAYNWPTYSTLGRALPGQSGAKTTNPDVVAHPSSFVIQSCDLRPQNCAQPTSSEQLCTSSSDGVGKMDPFCETNPSHYCKEDHSP